MRENISLANQRSNIINKLYQTFEELDIQHQEAFQFFVKDVYHNYHNHAHPVNDSASQTAETQNELGTTTLKLGSLVIKESDAQDSEHASYFIHRWKMRHLGKEFNDLQMKNKL